MKGTLEQRLAFGVLSTWARVDKEGDLICRHCKVNRNTSFGHAKGCIVTEAFALFGLKDEFAFNKRTFKFKRQPLLNPRTKPSSFPPLGETQKSVLKSLEREPWHEWCGWVWNNYSGTKRILDSLVKRGLVVHEILPSGKELWRLK